MRKPQKKDDGPSDTEKNYDGARKALIKFRRHVLALADDPDGSTPGEVMVRQCLQVLADYHTTPSRRGPEL